MAFEIHGDASQISQTFQGEHIQLDQNLVQLNMFKTLRQLDTKVSFHTKTHDNTTALYALFVHFIMPCSICSQPSLLTML